MISHYRRGERANSHTYMAGGWDHAENLYTFVLLPNSLQAESSGARNAVTTVEAPYKMIKAVKFAIPAAVVGLGILASSSLSFGTPKIAKDTGVKPCTVCHTAMGKKDLNKAGECYKGKKDLKACEIAAPAK